MKNAADVALIIKLLRYTAALKVSTASKKTALTPKNSILHEPEYPNFMIKAFVPKQTAQNCVLQQTVLNMKPIHTTGFLRQNCLRNERR